MGPNNHHIDEFAVPGAFSSHGAKSPERSFGWTNVHTQFVEIYPLPFEISCVKNEIKL